MGPEARKVFNTFELSKEQQESYDPVKCKFIECFLKAEILVYESACFHSRSKGHVELVDQLATMLRTVAQGCDFGVLTERIIRPTGQKSFREVAGGSQNYLNFCSEAGPAETDSSLPAAKTASSTCVFQRKSDMFRYRCCQQAKTQKQVQEVCSYKSKHGPATIQEGLRILWWAVTQEVSLSCQNLHMIFLQEMWTLRLSVLVGWERQSGVFGDRL